MQMVRIQIPNATQRGEALLALIRRGRVVCLPGDVLVVPDPALELLRTLGVSFIELGPYSIDLP
jgi:hypothetical protein